MIYLKHRWPFSDVSRSAEVVVSLFQRLQGLATPNAPKLPPASLSATSRLPKSRQAPLEPTKETIVLGSARIRPRFLDQTNEDMWLPLGANGAEVHVQILFRKIAVSILYHLVSFGNTQFRPKN